MASIVKGKVQRPLISLLMSFKPIGKVIESKERTLCLALNLLSALTGIILNAKVRICESQVNSR